MENKTGHNFVAYIHTNSSYPERLEVSAQDQMGLIRECILRSDSMFDEDIEYTDSMPDESIIDMVRFVTISGILINKIREISSWCDTHYGYQKVANSYLESVNLAMCEYSSGGVKERCWSNLRFADEFCSSNSNQYFVSLNEKTEYTFRRIAEQMEQIKEVKQ